MNESRPMRNRMPPRERGEWGTERRRGSAASGEPNAAAGARRAETECGMPRRRQKYKKKRRAVPKCRKKHNKNSQIYFFFNTKCRRKCHTRKPVAVVVGGPRDSLCV